MTTLDDSTAQPVGSSPIEPVQLSPEQEDLCQRLDDLHAKSGHATKPSYMFRGAIFISQNALRTNPDWMAQAANSLREILYEFNLKDGLEQYGSVGSKKPGVQQEAGRVFGILTKLAHHGRGRGKKIEYTAVDFEKLVADFERVMKEVLQRQVDIHEEIDMVVGLDPQTIA
jgi:hypothetical protein